MQSSTLYHPFKIGIEGNSIYIIVFPFNSYPYELNTNFDATDPLYMSSLMSHGIRIRPDPPLHGFVSPLKYVPVKDPRYVNESFISVVVVVVVAVSSVVVVTIVTVVDVVHVVVVVVVVAVIVVIVVVTTAVSVDDGICIYKNAKHIIGIIMTLAATNTPINMFGYDEKQKLANLLNKVLFGAFIITTPFNHRRLRLEIPPDDVGTLM